MANQEEISPQGEAIEATPVDKIDESRYIDTSNEMGNWVNNEGVLKFIRNEEEKNPQKIGNLKSELDKIYENKDSLEGKPDAAGEILDRGVVQKIESFTKRESSIGMELLLGEKVNMLLVKAGVKPATHIDVFGDYDEKGDKIIDGKSDILQGEIDKVIDFLKSIGLEYRVGKPGVRKQVYKKSSGSITVTEEFSQIYTGLNRKTIDNLYRASEEGNGSLGLALGYPETAVEAFENDEVKDRFGPDFSPEIKGSEYYPFVSFLLSKKNWRNELKTAEKWARVVKENSLKLFDEYTKAVMEARGRE